MAEAGERKALGRAGGQDGDVGGITEEAAAMLVPVLAGWIEGRPGGQEALLLGEPGGPFPRSGHRPGG